MKKSTKIYFTSIGAIIATLGLLHTYGYRIYGHAYMYWPKPDMTEGWTQISSFEAPSTIKLTNGKSIDVSPLELTEKGTKLPASELVYSLFQTPIDEFYLRENEEGIWTARIHDRFLCTLPHWLPERRIGFYEDELRSRLYFGDPITNRQAELIDLPEETSDLEYIKSIRQNKSVDTTRVSARRNSNTPDTLNLNPTFEL